MRQIRTENYSFLHKSGMCPSIRAQIDFRSAVMCLPALCLSAPCTHPAPGANMARSTRPVEILTRWRFTYNTTPVTFSTSSSCNAASTSASAAHIRVSSEVRDRTPNSTNTMRTQCQLLVIKRKLIHIPIHAALYRITKDSQIYTDIML